jgi:hypothetical protein
MSAKASLRFRALVRSVAALCGLALLLPLLMVEVLASKSGWTPGFLLALFLVGAPCGLLLYFARTGRWALGSVLVAPVLVLVQSTAVLFFLGRFPHSPAIYMTSSVIAPWLAVVPIHRFWSNRAIPQTAT